MDAPVLLTGATGYIGGRLLRHFEEAGRPVRCLARNPERVRATRSTTEVVQGDCLDEASLDLALAGVDSAYYLVHSMSVGADFAEVDRQAAANFGRAAARAVVRRIIYLGGLADQAVSLSSHLQSRAETGSVLRASGIPVDRASRQVTQNRRRRGTAVGLSSGCAIGWRRAIERCDTPRMTHERIRLGISACLLGEPVRLDGGHKRDPFLVESLGQFVDWGAGVPRGGVRLDAPRESMRLVQTDVRLRGATVSG